RRQGARDRRPDRGRRPRARSTGRRVSAVRQALLGVDLGTARIKVGLVSPSGELLAIARAPQPMDVDPATGRAEQDPDDWWHGLRSATREALAAASAAGHGDMEIVGVAIAGHGPTAAPVDADGRPTGPALTWLDSRSAGERDELEAETGLRGWALGV